MRLGQNIDGAATHRIGVAAAVGGLAGGPHGLAETGGRLAVVAAYGGNGLHRAALAGIAYGHGTAAGTAKALYGNGAVGLYADIHGLKLEPITAAWQAGGMA